jgi:hypothetical protein
MGFTDFAIREIHGCPRGDPSFLRDGSAEIVAGLKVFLYNPYTQQIIQ